MLFVFTYVLFMFISIVGSWLVDTLSYLGEKKLIFLSCKLMKWSSNVTYHYQFLPFLFLLYHVPTIIIRCSITLSPQYNWQLTHGGAQYNTMADIIKIYHFYNVSQKIITSNVTLRYKYNNTRKDQTTHTPTTKESAER